MFRNSWLVTLTITLLAAQGLSGCATESVTRGGATGINSKSLMLYDANLLDQQAETAYRDMLGEARARRSLNSNPATTARLRRIGDRLIRHVAVFRDDAPHWGWEINLIRSGDLNAFCMPGGKIAFYTGIIDKLRLTDDEIAAIMGHEIAHALREHSRSRLSRALVADTLLLGAGNVLDIGRAATRDLAQITQLLLKLPHSRKHETEADIMGLELAARAGFDPAAAVRVWQKMSAQGGSSVPEFQSTHPSHSTRINTIRSKLPIVLPLYANGAGSPVPVAQPDINAKAASLRSEAFNDERDSFKKAIDAIEKLKREETRK